MEIVLLWLDELDDLLFSGALAWEPLRLRALQIGLTASVTLVLSESSVLNVDWAPALAAVAAASVGLWIAGAFCALARRCDTPPLQSPA
jgi:hypothetical protein